MNLKDKFFNTTGKKCFIIFIIVFAVVAIGGVLSINYIHDTVTNNHIHSDKVTVMNKTDDNGAYYIFGTNNKTYIITAHESKYNKKIFNSMNIGAEYKIIVREPELIDTNELPHIIQVYNGTV